MFRLGPRAIALLKASIVGVIFGACFPAFSYFMRDDAVQLYFVICTAPVVLGIFSYFLGMTNYRASEVNTRAKDLEELLELQGELSQERVKSMHNAKLASIGEMAAGVAHEINNPLAVIVGAAESLEFLRNDEERFVSKVDVILRASVRIEKIVKGLKKYSRLSHKTEHKLESVLEIVNEALVIVQAKARQLETNIEVQIPEDLKILCDQIEIEQVFVNLINNGLDAVRSQPEKWIKIVGFRLNDGICLQVIDSGGGISSEVESKLFQPFFTTKGVGEGTGLGLSICQNILRDHNGTLALNRSFKNTCFEIKFG